MMSLVYRLATSIGFEYCEGYSAIRKSTCVSQNIHNLVCVSNSGHHHPQVRQGVNGGEHGEA